MSGVTGDNGGKPSFRDHLRDELVAAAARQSDRRQRRRTAAGRIVVVFVIGIVAVSAVFALRPSRSEAGVLNVQRANGLTTVTLKDLSATPVEISKELRHQRQGHGCSRCTATNRNVCEW
jgi:hypothetical protein